MVRLLLEHLEAGRSRVQFPMLMDSSIDVIHSAVLRTQRLTEMSTRNLLGGKRAAGA
jgi:hypothetical protein